MMEASRHGVPFEIVDAVVSVESGYNSSALGAAGEIGLMQVLPSTAELMGFKGNRAELVDPIINVAVGTKYLAQAWKIANGDICTAVMKYRAGHGEKRFSQKSVDYCVRVRGHLKASGFSVTGTVPKVNLFAANNPQLSHAEIVRLSAFGDWVPYKNNYVWRPRGITNKWRPYTVGNWSYTKHDGWKWESAEQFGWATYHYGRWGRSKQYGWYWAPDDLWAPAWIAWRLSKEYIAWAPLPPGQDCIAVKAKEKSCTIPSNRWVSVPIRNFLDEDLSSAAPPKNIEAAALIGTVALEGQRITNKSLSIDILHNRNEN